MAKILIPANNLVVGTNELKVWCPDASPGTITSIKVVASEEAGILSEAFDHDGDLIGPAQDGTTTISISSSDRAAQNLITDMESDSRLSPSEKTTWRQSWNNIAADYGQATSFAASLSVDYSQLTFHYNSLLTVLQGAGVWSKPAETYILPDDSISTTSQSYRTEYKKLADACTDKVGKLTEQKAVDYTDTVGAATEQKAVEYTDTVAVTTETNANDYTRGWSEQGADVTATSTFVQVEYPNKVTDFQNQIDGKIISWFTSVDPSLTWDGTNAQHAGDMWWHSDSKILRRYSGSSWGDPITDPKAIEAYDNASTAQDTADQKRRVFTSTPYGPYDVGDLWSDSVGGEDVRRANTARSSGFVAGDWVVVGDVTGDNTAADTTAVGGTAATTVITDLNTAKTNAEGAITAVATMGDDAKLSIDEKSTWRRQWDSIMLNYNHYVATGVRLGVSHIAMQAAGDALYNYLADAGVWTRPDTADSITASALNNVVKTYYDAVEEFLTACVTAEANKAKNDAIADAATKYDPNADETAAVIDAAIAQAKIGGKTMIEGGYILTDVIEADLLYGKRIKIDSSDAPSASFPVTTSNWGTLYSHFSATSRSSSLGFSVKKTNSGGGSAIYAHCSSTSQTGAAVVGDNASTQSNSYGGYFTSAGGDGIHTPDNVYAGGGVGPFTGTHIGYAKESDIVMGYTVTAQQAMNYGPRQNLFILVPVNSPQDKRVIGVISSLGTDPLPLLLNSPHTSYEGESGDRLIKPEFSDYVDMLTVGGYKQITINALGDGGITVCADSGNIEEGDYLCSSPTLGCVMKQSDDLLHSYTVAKALESVTWSEEPTATKTIACTYHCG